MMALTLIYAFIIGLAIGRAQPWWLNLAQLAILAVLVAVTLRRRTHSGESDA